MRGPFLALSFLTLALGWLIFFGAGVRSSDFHAALLFLGATALFYWTFRTGQTPPRLPVWQTIMLWAIPVYALFQLVPLPPPVLEVLSPSRALLTQSLGGVVSNIANAPISVAPPASIYALFGLLGCLTMFSLLRDITWRFNDSHPWAPAAPLAGIAVVEAAFGLGQSLSGPPKMSVSGTLSSPEHFTALLEMALPFTLVFGFISFRRYQAQQISTLATASKVAAAWGASLLSGAVLIQSPSAVSHTVVAATLFILVGLGLIPRLKTRKLRWMGAGTACAVALLALLALAPPPDFVESLATLGSLDQQPEARLAIWNNSATLFGEFRWFGTGPGGFESTFLKYQGSTDLSRIQNPGNDILSLLISFGAVGFAIFAAALVGVIRPALTGSLFLSEEPRRLLAVATSAAILGAVLRSGLESSLSVPALAMTFAWLAGLSQSAGLE